MTDRELLELAAKAAGIEIVFGNYDRDCYANITEEQAKSFGNYETGFEWNPLTDDGDALRLAVKLGLVVDCSRPSAGEPYKHHAIWLDELMSNEELTRRAIVRAAAEIAMGVAQSVGDDLPEDDYYKSMAEAEEIGRAADVEKGMKNPS